MNADDIARLVVDRTDEGIFTVNRDIFRDPEIFELEMRFIFERGWVFLGLASQAPQPNDYFTTWLGRQPVIVMRSAEGELGAFMNTCRHRGAQICQKRQGNARYHVCPYHGWSYDSSGKSKTIKDLQSGCYSDAFHAENHDLVPVPRFEQYRGFLFGCLDANVQSLDDHLNDARFFLDLVVDQSPDGIEAVPGSSTYTFRGNWKLQMENGLDAYHLTSTHPSFMKLVERRNSSESRYQLKSVDFASFTERGGFTFENGHAALFTPNPNPQIRPLYASIDELQERVGKDRAAWMLTTRNLVLFPNVQVAENASLQLRVIRPLAPDLTEMTIYCLAPVGESDKARDFRLRQFEDFFNSTGMATPDDTTCYEDCQAGYRAQIVQWQQGYARGMTSVQAGTNEIGERIGIQARTSQMGEVKVQDETLFHAGYRAWAEMMTAGLAAEHAERTERAAHSASAAHPSVQPVVFRKEAL
ncbi:aromatic ring-hydroxylating dioxygenase subunit alpha [Paraburkholderia fungorum]|uniref:aromatic ring-hydroxylating oxygenase subunit alpha n=1 Tax=Paraburkholderia fungorum TaxID=134537 RepID=UPI0038BD02CF